jgi:hypothetical protein
VTCSSEAPGTTYAAMQRHIPEDQNSLLIYLLIIKKSISGIESMDIELVITYSSKIYT